MSMRAIALGVGTALLLGVGAGALGAFGAPRDVLALLPGGVRPALAEDDRAEIGVDYRYELPTHCGVEYAFFNGRWWTATPMLYENKAKVSPPPGWDNPKELGTMHLVSRDEALFVGDSGNAARFVPGPKGGPGTTCG
jgi:hypothetical protein